LQGQLRKLAAVSARVVAVIGVSATVVFATVVVRVSWLPILLPVLPPTPLVQYTDRPFFFNGTFRAVYRHSIVPGGVYSAEEVQAAILRDPVVAGHYAKLDRTRVVGAVLEQPRAVYVSYRIGQRTLWTSSKIMLPAGERLLTDGTRVVRARCGNLVSETGGDQGVADASGERVDLAELDQPVVVAPGPEPAAVAAVPGEPLAVAGGTPVALAAGAPEPGPFFQPVAGALPFVLGGGEPTNETPGGPGGPEQSPGGPTTTTGVVIVPAPTTTTGRVPTTTTGTPTTTTTGTVPPLTTTTGTEPPTATTTAMATTGVFVPPTTMTSTTTMMPSTITTMTPTTGTVPEPTRLALLVLAWVAFRYTRRT
jgi:hypothetical protein